MNLLSTNLAVAALGFAAILGCHFALLWLWKVGSIRMVWFLAPAALGVSGVLLVASRWYAPDYLGAGLGHGLIVASFCFLWQGIRTFERLRPQFAPVVVIVGGWLALAGLPGFLESGIIRTIVMSSAEAILCALSALTLWRGRKEEPLPSRLPTVIVLWSYAALMVARIVTSGVMPYPFGGLQADARWLGAFSLIVVAHVAALAVLMTAMNEERVAAGHHIDPMHDPLTGLLSGKAFFEQAEKSVYRPKFGRALTSLLAIDIDGFRGINERLGHAAGDRILQALAEIVVRESGPAPCEHYRIGEDRFVLVLRDASLRDAIDVAERIRCRFELRPHGHGSAATAMTVSIGIATTDFAGFDLEVLYAAAEAAMREAKMRGRNRVVVADPTAIPRPQSRLAAVPVRRAG